MYDVECPYCNAGLEICHDDGEGYEEGLLYQQECCYCDKVFVFRTTITFNYTAERAACLNGGRHNYKKTITFPPEAARLQCVMCEEEKLLQARK